MFGKNKLDKEIYEALAKENRRLKLENQRLIETLDKVSETKEEYAKLIERLKFIEEEYLAKIKEFEKMEIEYKNTLDELIKETKREK